jgi:hypothetical protein
MKLNRAAAVLLSTFGLAVGVSGQAVLTVPGQPRTNHAAPSPRSTTSSGCSSCSSRKESRTTEIDSIEPPYRCGDRDRNDLRIEVLGIVIGAIAKEFHREFVCRTCRILSGGSAMLKTAEVVRVACWVEGNPLRPCDSSQVKASVRF